jgi:hypothetical protein
MVAVDFSDTICIYILFYFIEIIHCHWVKTQLQLIKYYIILLQNYALSLQVQ